MASESDLGGIGYVSAGAQFGRFIWGPRPPFEGSESTREDFFSWVWAVEPVSDLADQEIELAGTRAFACELLDEMRVQWAPERLVALSRFYYFGDRGEFLGDRRSPSAKSAVHSGSATVGVDLDAIASGSLVVALRSLGVARKVISLMPGESALFTSEPLDVLARFGLDLVLAPRRGCISAVDRAGFVPLRSLEMFDHDASRSALASFDGRSARDSQGVLRGSRRAGRLKLSPISALEFLADSLWSTELVPVLTALGGDAFHSAYPDDPWVEGGSLHLDPRPLT